MTERIPLNKESYTLQELVPILGLTYKTIHKYAMQGKIKASKVGGRWRVMKDDLQMMIGQPVTAEQVRIAEIADVLRERPEVYLLMTEAAKLPEDTSAEIIGQLVSFLRERKKQQSRTPQEQ